MKKIKGWIWHPFLFAAYPVLALLAYNLGESRVTAGMRSLVLVLFVAAVLLLLTYLLLRNWQKAAMITTLAIVLFFSYGHVYNFLEQATSLGRHRLLLPLFGVLFILGVIWIVRKGRDLKSATEILNLVGLVLLIFPIYQIFAFQISSTQLWGGNDTQKSEVVNTQPVEAENLPDVYYIILDAYARNDTMQRSYDFDNSEFLGQLENLGFYVAECSQSNYAKTRLSLASSLNMNYLDTFDEIAGDLERGRESRIRMGHLIRRSQVRQIFEDLGYTTVGFSNGYLWSEWEDADIFLSPDNASTFGNMQLFSRINDFEALLLRTTAALAVIDAETVFSSYLTPAVVASPRKDHYDQVMHALDTLDNISAIESPKFVFAHIISPHGPYVMSAEGEFIPADQETDENYVDQVEYLNSRLIPIVEKILQNSENPPIIILQADHGGHGTQFDPDNRMNILNVYYLPNGGEAGLYPSISPVNSFRLILSEYFGYDFPLLEDTSYFSTIENFFDFSLVPNNCKPK